MIDFDLVAVIPARLNSSRVEKKVFQKVADRETLLARKIRQLRLLLPKDRVVVNTEAEEIAEVAEQSGASVMFRDDYYSDGHKASFSEVIVHVVEKLDAEHVAWTPFVVPFFDELQFEQSFKNYSDNVISGTFDSLVSVTKMIDYVWDSHKPLNYTADRNHTVSQDLPNWYRVTNGNYMAPRELMLKHKYLLGEDVFLDIRDEKCSIDIDTLHDLNLAKAYEKVVRKSL